VNLFVVNSFFAAVRRLLLLGTIKKKVKESRQTESQPEAATHTAPKQKTPHCSIGVLGENCP
jgi:hypothetical protein